MNLRSLLRDVPGVRSVGAGTIGGTLRLAGRRVESPDDLVGRFELDLSRVQPLQFPVLRQIGRFLGPIQPTTSFESGKATGRLANGIVHLDQFAIDGGVARILIEGSGSLRGRLDLDVTAKTGDLVGAQSELARLVRSPITLAAPVPVSLLAEANDLLVDRLIYLHIGGTVKRPAVRLQPARQLQQESLRFFLRRAVNSMVDE
jgi:hypothetical protein